MQFATQFATPQIWLGGRTEAEKFAIKICYQICYTRDSMAVSATQLE
jgi:hypothetical protein